MEFVDRTDELATLNDFWFRQGFQFLHVYGRRRVGKTALLRSFIEGKRGAYYLCSQVAEKPQLAALGRAVGQALHDPFLAERGFGDWEQFFEYIGRAAKASAERLVLVLDEYLYLLASTSGVSSLFQRAIDLRWSESNLMLVLSGSHMGMMENEVLGYQAPLYGRRTGQLHLRPMEFPEASLFFPGSSLPDRMSLFAICGGIPAYLSCFRTDRSLEENVIANFGREEEFLAQEVEFLLRQELKEVRYYFSIIWALASGHRKLGLVVNETGLDKAVAGKYLKVLSDLHVVEREVPVLEPHPDKSRKGLYRICDPLFRFYFRFIFPNRHMLGQGGGARLWQEVISRRMHEFTSLAAEEVARTVVERSTPGLLRIGRQWDSSHELDIMAVDVSGNVRLAGEVKWWLDKPVGMNVLKELKAKVEHFGIDPEQPEYVIFCPGGFTSELKRQKGVRLMDF